MRNGFSERRARGGGQELVLPAALLLAVLSTPAVAEEFEVLVLRGSTVSRVTGDESGPLSEVTLREDPYPAPPAPPAEAPFEPEVVIRIDRGETSHDRGSAWLYPWRRTVLPLPPARPFHYGRSSRYGHDPFRLGGAAPSRSRLPGGPRGLRSRHR